MPKMAPALLVGACTDIVALCVDAGGASICADGRTGVCGVDGFVPGIPCSSSGDSTRTLGACAGPWP